MSSNLHVEIDQATLKELVVAHFSSILVEINLTPADITIEVKSNQNYKSEWESAAFRAVLDKVI